MRAAHRKTSVKRDPEGTRKRILDAARDAFSRGGYAGARVDAIARAAGTNERMLYYYFGSKEGLFLAVLEGAYLELAQAERQLELESKDPVSAVRELVAFTWNYYLDHPELIRLVNSENLHEARHLKKSERIGELVSPIIHILERLLKRGQAAGVFRQDVDPVQCYITIAALGYFFLSNRHTLSTVLGRDLATPQARAEHLAHNTDVILGFLAQHPSAERR